MAAPDDIGWALDYLGSRQPVTRPKLSLTTSSGGGPVTAPVTPLAPTPAPATPPPAAGGPAGRTAPGSGGGGDSGAIQTARRLLGISETAARLGGGVSSAFGLDFGQTGAVGGPVAGPEGIEGAQSVLDASTVPGAAGSGIGDVVSDILPFLGTASGLADIGQIIAGPGRADDKTLEAIKEALAIAVPGVGALQLIGGIFGADPLSFLNSWFSHRGSYVPHRQEAAGDISTYVPELFENIQLATSSDALRQAIELSPLATNPEFKIKLSEATPGDPLSAQFSGGYEYGDQVWPSVNPKLSTALKAQSDLIRLAGGGDQNAMQFLQQQAENVRQVRAARAERDRNSIVPLEGAPSD